MLFDFSVVFKMERYFVLTLLSKTVLYFIYIYLLLEFHTCAFIHTYRQADRHTDRHLLHSCLLSPSLRFMLSSFNYYLTLTTPLTTIVTFLRWHM